MDSSTNRRTTEHANSANQGVIVIIEDDRHIADLVDLYLRNAGFKVLQASNAARGLDLIAQHQPNLVMVDIGLPGPMDGLDACRELRRTTDIPIMIVTARDDEVDRVIGLEIGADDYVTKPFSPRELVARVRAILRRAERSNHPTNGPLAIGGLIVSTERREVLAGGEAVSLTAREFDLLAHFVLNPGRVYTRQQLLDAVWGQGWFGDERTVDVHVRQLRRKLGDHFPLTTIWGVGYRCD